MNKFHVCVVICFISCITFLNINIAFSDSEIDQKGLIISEVYLDSLEVSNNWVEVSNPTSTTLILTLLRLTTLLTPS
jgi:hypothetical protein